MTSFRDLIVEVLDQYGTQTSVQFVLNTVCDWRCEELQEKFRKFDPEAYKVLLEGKTTNVPRKRVKELETRMDRFFSVHAHRAEPDYQYVVKVRKEYQRSKKAVYDCRTYTGQPARDMRNAA